MNTKNTEIGGMEKEPPAGDMDASAQELVDEASGSGTLIDTPNATLDEVPQVATQSALLENLGTIQQMLANLQQTFADKIAEDEYKNGLFDNMHRELVRYQNGALDKQIDAFALDIIQLVDITKNHVRIYEDKEPTQENYRKLLGIVQGVVEDLGDVLYRQNIEAYNVPGSEVDARRQKIIQTIPTDDKTKDNLVAVRSADGYEKDGKVLRPERVKIFRYETPAPDTDNNFEAPANES